MKTSILIIIVIFLFSSCSNKEDQNTSQNNDLKKKELELKEKELQLKEKEMMNKQESELKENEKQIDQQTSRKKADLLGTFEGTIKDGTNWFIVISKYNGRGFSGFNKVYWKSTPEGYKTDFVGTYDNSTNEIIMYEDKNMKGSGKFVGTLSSDANSISGTWYRYTDNGSFTWQLQRSFEKGQ